LKTNYQVFISFKNSDDKTEEDTLDKDIAYKIYSYLTDRGLEVFFSPITLKALGRDSWSEEIDSAALKQSKVFIAVGTQKEYMNAKQVKEERDKFFGLKLNDKSRAIYGYIASPMRLKDLPDDMRRIEVFQDKKSDALKSLYTYIRNHLAHTRNIVSEEVRGFNKNYLFIGFLILFGVFLFNSNDNEALVKIIKEERLEDKKVIEEQKQDKEESNRLLLVYKKEIELLRQELKNNPKKLKEIEEKAKKIAKDKGLQASLYFLKNINLNYKNTAQSLGFYIASGFVNRDINSTLLTYDTFHNENLFFYYAGHGSWDGCGSLISSDTNSTLKYNFMNYLDAKTYYGIEINHNFTYQNYFTFKKDLYSDDSNLSFNFSKSK